MSKKPKSEPAAPAPAPPLPAWPYGETDERYVLKTDHTPIWRWRFVDCYRASGNPWRYVDHAGTDLANWPMQKAKLEGNIELEGVTASRLRELLDEAYEEGRRDERFGCETGHRPAHIGLGRRRAKRLRQKVRMWAPQVFRGLSWPIGPEERF